MWKLRVAGDPHSCTSLGVLGFRVTGYLILVALVFPILTGLRLAAAEPEPRAKNVLVLFSGHGEQVNEFLNILESSLRARVRPSVNFLVSYLDPSVSEEKWYLDDTAETFHRQYLGAKLDFVITSGSQALLLAAQHRDQIFPGVPIVFIAITARELEQQRKWTGVTGVTVPVGLGGRTAGPEVAWGLVETYLTAQYTM